MTIIDQIKQIFDRRGNEIYAGEDVTQMQHATQCARLAKQDNAPDHLIVAALLHDVGHIAGESDLPSSCQENLDDAHEDAGYEYLRKAFGENVLAPVRLHVAAKRYLCTVDEEYRSKLSPVSLKSLADQGGIMNDEELQTFRAHPYFEEAVRLRHWDDQAKDPNLPDETIEEYLPFLQRVMETSAQNAV